MNGAKALLPAETQTHPEGFAVDGKTVLGFGLFDALEPGGKPVPFVSIDTGQGPPVCFSPEGALHIARCLVELADKADHDARRAAI